MDHQSTLQNLAEEETDPDNPPPPDDDEEISDQEDDEDLLLTDPLSYMSSSSDDSRISLPPSELDSDGLVATPSRLSTSHHLSIDDKVNEDDSGDDSDMAGYLRGRKRPRRHLTADRIIASAGSSANENSAGEGTSVQRSTRSQVFYGRVRRTYTKKRKED